MKRVCRWFSSKIWFLDMYMEWNKFLHMSIFLNWQLCNLPNSQKKKLKRNKTDHISEIETKTKTQFYSGRKWNRELIVNKSRKKNLAFFCYFTIDGFGDLCQQQNLISFCAYEVLKIIKMSCNTLIFKQRLYI